MLAHLKMALHLPGETCSWEFVQSYWVRQKVKPGSDRKKDPMLGIGNCVFHLFCALICIVLCFYDWPNSGDLVSDGSSDEKHLIFGHRVCACSSCSCVCVCVCACVCVCVCVCHDWLASFWRSRKQWQRWWGASSGWPSWTQRPLSLTSSCQGQTPCKKVLGHRICKKETN